MISKHLRPGTSLGLMKLPSNLEIKKLLVFGALALFVFCALLDSAVSESAVLDCSISRSYSRTFRENNGYKAFYKVSEYDQDGPSIQTTDLLCSQTVV